MKRIAGGWFAIVVSLAAVSGCKCGSSSTRDAPAALASATTGEALPDAVIEIGSGEVTFNGKVVGTSEVVEGQNLAMPLQGLAGVLSEAAQGKGEHLACMLTVEAGTAQLFTSLVIDTIAGSPFGGDLYLDTTRGVVRLVQGLVRGRALVAELEGERQVRLYWQNPGWVQEQDIEFVDVARDVEFETANLEMRGLDQKIRELWKKQAGGANYVLIRPHGKMSFVPFAAAIRSADRARREIAKGKVAFEIGTAPWRSIGAEDALHFHSPPKPVPEAEPARE
ncbi:MAG TPA: hypothetical protein PKA88_25595 [Polyangiaceae bacterium]|nr:hypothetical protein [Polyangiaceae bacterium]HMR78217.1 hypothetical protein [Polyangiaceae bacterium]